MNLSPATLAENAAVLELVSAALQSAGYATDLIEDEQVPVPTLLVALEPDEEARERILAISLMPFGGDGLASTDLVQFYVRMPFAVTDQSPHDLMAATAVVNASMAIGHFAIRGDELYYRYVLAVPNDAAPDTDMLCDVVPLVAFHQEHFGDYLQGVNEGEISLRTLPDVMARTAPRQGG